MGELPLRGLLFLFGAFALVSAGLKVRSAPRTGLGIGLLTLVEGLAGVGLVATTVPGVVPLPMTAAAGMTTVGVVLFSTLSHLAKLRSFNRAREESAGSRLYASITYGIGNAPSKANAGGPEEPRDSADPQVDLAATDEVGFADPITAALQSGRFDAESFIRSQSAGASASPEGGGADREGPAEVAGHTDSVSATDPENPASVRDAPSGNGDSEGDADPPGMI